MSDQVKFVGVHKEREREERGRGHVIYYVGSSKIRGSTYRERRTGEGRERLFYCKIFLTENKNQKIHRGKEKRETERERERVRERPKH